MRSAQSFGKPSSQVFREIRGLCMNLVFLSFEKVKVLNKVLQNRPSQAFKRQENKHILLSGGAKLDPIVRVSAWAIEECNLRQIMYLAKPALFFGCLKVVPDTRF